MVDLLGPYALGFGLLALWLGVLVFMFFKLIRCSLMEYMLILITAGAPYGLLLNFKTPQYLDEWMSFILLGLGMSSVVFFGSVKGLRWAQRRQIEDPSARMWMIFLGWMVLPCTIGLGFGVVVMSFVFIQFLLERPEFRALPEIRAPFFNTMLKLCALSLVSGIFAYLCWRQEQLARKAEYNAMRRAVNLPDEV